MQRQGAFTCTWKILSSVLWIACQVSRSAPVPGFSGLIEQCLIFIYIYIYIYVCVCVYSDVFVARSFVDANVTPMMLGL